MPLRVYLTGRLVLEADGAPLDTRHLPGRQGRRALAYLLCERGRPVPREELAEAIWQGDAPPAWDAALSALTSKLRALLRGLSWPVELASAFGCYELRLPPDAWVDREAAAQAIDQAEGLLRRGEPHRAWAHACVANAIARRAFLPGEEGAWIERQRARLRALLLRSLDCLAECSCAGGQATLALQAAEDAVALEPFRESGYLRLMRVHLELGNRAEALRVYDRCRRLLAEELGADPSPQLEALYLELLGQA
jgi:DNA-binding SARP family transcriptional activator